MKRKKGFVFVETIIVTCILLSSLMVIYAMYITTVNSESRYLRYDDPAKLYDTYYVKKYLEGYYLEDLIADLKKDCTSFSQEDDCKKEATCGWNSTLRQCQKEKRYELIYQGRGDLFGTYYSQELGFFDGLWNSLHISNIYLLPSNISEIANCKLAGFESLCFNTNLVTYLKSIDNAPSDSYVMIVEYSQARSGAACSSTSSDCLTYYVHMTIGGGS